MSLCPKCGTDNESFASRCKSCDEVLSMAPASRATEEVPNYLVHSILVTLCCCLPFGIASILQAVKVNENLKKGDVEGAKEASEKAKKFAIIGAAVGGVINVIYFFVNFASGLAQGLSH